MPDGPVIGGAYITVRPLMEAFQGEVQAGVARSTSAVGRTAAKVPVGADTAQFDQATARMSGQIKSLAETAAGIFAVDKGADIIKQSIGDASSTQLLESRASAIFGPVNQQVQQFVTKNHEAFLLTQHDAEQSVVAFGNYFESLGIGSDKAAGMAEKMTQLAGTLHALNPDLGDTTTVVESLQKSIETGSTRGLAALGVHFSNADIQAEALADGLVKVDTNQTKAQDSARNLQIAQDNLARVQSQHPAIAQKTSDAQAKLTTAQNAYAEAVKRTGSEQSQPALLAAQRVQKAQEDLAKSQANVGKGYDDVLKAQNAADAANTAYQKSLQGTNVALDDAAKSQAVQNLLLKAAPQYQQQLAAASGDAALAQQRASVAWHDALESLGNRLLPHVTDAFTQLASWLDAHQSSFAKFGDDMGTAFGYVKDTIQFIGDHKTVFETLAITIGGLFALDKVAGWAKTVQSVIGGLGSSAGRGSLLDKMLPGISSWGKSGAGAHPGAAAGIGVPHVWVDNMPSGGMGGGAPGAGQIANVAKGGAARTAGSAVVGVALGVGAAEIGNVAADKLSGGRSANLNDVRWNSSGQIAGHDVPMIQSGNHPLAGQYGGNTRAEQLGATLKYFAEHGSGTRDEQAILQNALGSTGIKQYATSGAPDAANQLGQLSEFSKQYLGAGNPAVKEYHDLAQAVADGKVKTSKQFDDWLAQENINLGVIKQAQAPIQKQTDTATQLAQQQQLQLQLQQQINDQMQAHLRQLQQVNADPGSMAGVTVVQVNNADPAAVGAEVQRQADVKQLADVRRYGGQGIVRS